MFSSSLSLTLTVDMIRVILWQCLQGFSSSRLAVPRPINYHFQGYATDNCVFVWEYFSMLVPSLRNTPKYKGIVTQVLKHYCDSCYWSNFYVQDTLKTISVISLILRENSPRNCTPLYSEYSKLSPYPKIQPRRERLGDTGGTMALKLLKVPHFNLKVPFPQPCV